ncbi:MAG: hypothetical protein JNM88_11535 [Chitinophagaceae bacterium]|nr:hypothetical protein [Chitinophagaceae bacterium]
MSSTSEKGHAKNVANFETLITCCTGYGADYQPSNALLEIGKITPQWQEAKNLLSNVDTYLTEHNAAVNARVKVFKPLKKLSTKLINSLASSKAAPETIEDAKGFKRKIDGVRAQKVIPAQPTPENPAPVDNSISPNQQSIDQMIQHFGRLIKLLANEPKFKPNEEDLKIPAITALHTEMEKVNTLVKQTAVALSSSRIKRNTALYNLETGLVQTAADIKKYVKSVYEAGSPQYKQISKIQFRRYKN